MEALAAFGNKLALPIVLRRGCSPKQEEQKTSQNPLHPKLPKDIVVPQVRAVRWRQPGNPFTFVLMNGSDGAVVVDYSGSRVPGDYKDAGVGDEKTRSRCPRFAPFVGANLGNPVPFRTYPDRNNN